MLSICEIEAFIGKYIDGVKPPISDLIYYRRSIGADCFGYRINSAGVNNILRDAIIFVSDRPNYFFLRVSLSFRKKGVKTILLSRWGVEKEQEVFFDHIILYDSILDLKGLENAVNCIIYVQSWVGWNFLPVYIKHITSQKIACNVNDLTNLLFDNKKYLGLIGLSREEAELDLLCEKYILDHFPFVSLPYDLKILGGISSDLTKRVGKSIFYFPCYPCPSFFTQAKRRELIDPINLLFVGGVPPDDRPDQVFKDAKMRDIVDDLLQGEFTLTVLNNPQLAIKRKNIKDQYPYFMELSANMKNFEFESGHPPWKLKDFTKEYQYGLMLYSFEGILISKPHYQYIVPSKLFSYVELGLPVIVIDEMLAVSEIVRQHGIGIVVSRDEVRELDTVLEKSEYDTYIDNINTFRERYNMDAMIEQVLVHNIE